jgi:DNA-binding NarL/FixJ family response regulator
MPARFIQVLVVDDYKPWRDYICSLLQTKPEFRVVAELADGLEAVQRAKELHPDLILLDIGLPALDGLEVAERIRQVAPAVKIIFLTLHSDTDVVRAALSAGAQGYVLKIDAVRELLTAVETGIEGLNSGETARREAIGRLD